MIASLLKHVCNGARWNTIYKKENTKYMIALSSKHVCIGSRSGSHCLPVNTNHTAGWVTLLHLSIVLICLSFANLSSCLFVNCFFVICLYIFCLLYFFSLPFCQHQSHCWLSHTASSFNISAHALVLQVVFGVLVVFPVCHYSILTLIYLIFLNWRETIEDNQRYFRSGFIIWIAEKQQPRKFVICVVFLSLFLVIFFTFPFSLFVIWSIFMTVLAESLVNVSICWCPGSAVGLEMFEKSSQVVSKPHGRILAVHAWQKSHFTTSPTWPCRWLLFKASPKAIQSHL